MNRTGTPSRHVAQHRSAPLVGRDVGRVVPGHAARRSRCARVRSESLTAFRIDGDAVHRLDVLLACFAIYVLMVAGESLQYYEEIAGSAPTSPRWPLAWAASLPWRPVVIGITAGFGVVAVVGVLARRRRAARMATFVAVLFYTALFNSIGRGGHSYHMTVLAAFFLALAPTLPREVDHERVETTLRLLLAAQAVVMLGYTMSGWWKVWNGLRALWGGGYGIFNGYSLPVLVAQRALETAEHPPLVDVIVAQPLAASLLHVGAAVLELGALFTVPFPRLAAAWAVGLCTMHLAIFWSMHIDFSRNVGLLLVLFCLSPFLARGHDDGDPGTRTA